MKINKKGAAIPIIGILLVLGIFGGVGLVVYYVFGPGSSAPLSVTVQSTNTGTGGVATLCPNVEDTTFTYNDFDKYVGGTDPASTATLTAGSDGPSSGTTVADDGTLTVSPGDIIELVVGENSATYFSKLVRHT